MQRFPNTRNVITKLKAINQIEPNQTFLYNRNPKNLEKLRIAYNNNGFHLEKPGKSFYNKLAIESSGKYISAKVIHIQDGPILEASSKEWAIKKHLCKTSNSSAFKNLARVFSDRCLKAGIYELRCDIERHDQTNLGSFLSILEENGIALTTEFERVNPSKPQVFKTVNKIVN